MEFQALRTWGIVASSAMMAAAIALSLQSTPPAQAQNQPRQTEIAQAPPPSAPVAFLVRFQGEGPIARSQAAAARGHEAAARREIEAQLIRQTPFNGLCFDRFTAGAAEVVLRSCEPVLASERAVYQQRWLSRLQVMRAVAYADANASAAQERTPG
jgi:hypothetical protein